MLICLKTNFESIFYTAPYSLKSKIEEAVKDYEGSCSRWEESRKTYFNNHNLNENEIEDNLYFLLKRGEQNRFTAKLIEEWREKENLVMEYRALNPHPVSTFHYKLLNMGAKVISDQECDVVIRLNTDTKRVSIDSTPKGDNVRLLHK